MIKNILLNQQRIITEAGINCPHYNLLCLLVILLLGPPVMQQKFSNLIVKLYFTMSSLRLIIFHIPTNWLLNILFSFVTGT